MAKIERLRTCVRQVEWILFVASMRGVHIDARSLDAVLESKSFLEEGNELSDLKRGKDGAWEAFKKYNDEKYDFVSLDEGTVAYICWRIALDVCCEHVTVQDVFEYYLSPLGDLQQRSPIWKYMVNYV